MGEEKDRNVITKEEFFAIESRVKEIGKELMELTEKIGSTIIVITTYRIGEPDRTNADFTFFAENFESVDYQDIAGNYSDENTGWKFKDKEENKDGE